MINHRCFISAAALFSEPILRHTSNARRTSVTLSNDNLNLDSLFKEKKILRSKVRKSLKSMDPSLKSQQDGEILGRKKIYVPRVEDKNSHMRMLNSTSTDDLIANSMGILEPAPVGADGSEHENVMQANEPVDLPDPEGGGGGYYDTLLKNYHKLAKERNWEQPLFVALSYSLQILDEGLIPITVNDVPIDALVSPSGVIPLAQLPWRGVDE